MNIMNVVFSVPEMESRIFEMDVYFLLIIPKSIVTSKGYSLDQCDLLTKYYMF